MKDYRKDVFLCRTNEQSVKMDGDVFRRENSPIYFVSGLIEKIAFNSRSDLFLALSRAWLI